MSYGPDRVEQYKRAAVFVDKILKGPEPADIPVEQPTTFELSDQSENRQDPRPDDSADRAHAGAEGD